MDTNAPNLVPSDPPPTPADPPARKLSDRHIRFVNEYLIDRNGTAAYLRAFGNRNTDGSLKSNATAAVEAHRLLSDPNLQAELKFGEERILAARQLTQERIIGAFIDIAFADPADAFTYNPESDSVGVVPPTELPIELRRAITGIEVKNTAHGQQIKYKFASREGALDKLCKHLGIKAGDDGIGDKLAALVDRLTEYKQTRADGEKPNG